MTTEIQISTENLGKLSPIAIFKKGGISPIIDAIKKEVSEQVPDTSTAKGRNSIASLAHKVAKSKTLLDKMGKALADDLNAKLKPINAERKQARDQLDALKEEIRQPLTDWEAEQKRIAEEEAARVEAEELAAKVEADHELGLLLHDKFLQEAIIKLEERVAAKCAHEREIAHAARVEAEQNAKAERAAVEAEKQKAIEAAEQAKRDQIAAEERAKLQAEQAEIARVEAKKQAVINAQLAAENAKKAEVARQEAERQLLTKAEAQRLANREHVANILGEIKLAIIGLGATEELAKSITLALYKNDIPHSTVKF